MFSLSNFVNCLGTALQAVPFVLRHWRDAHFIIAGTVSACQLKRSWCGWLVLQRVKV